MFLFKMSRKIFTEITAQKHFPIDWKSFCNPLVAIKRNAGLRPFLDLKAM